MATDDPLQIDLLYQGAIHNRVRDLQNALKKHGFEIDDPNGIFGADTRQAVVAFQAQQGLAVDGVVGPSTWKALGHTHQRTMQIYKLIEGTRDKRARRILQAARRTLMLREEPPGSNWGPNLGRNLLTDSNGLTYPQHAVWEDEDARPPWCAIAASQWIRWGHGETQWRNTPMGDWFGAVRQFEDWGKARHRVVTDPAPGALPGLLFTMPGHCGLVISRAPGYHNHAEHRVITIEGNVDNRVRWRIRNVATLTMLIRVT